uniref:Secreted protein n=1 Tax=Arundo donax TaxID=35708 RepID=A0A0A9GJ80_ARUDO
MISMHIVNTLFLVGVCHLVVCHKEREKVCSIYFVSPNSSEPRHGNLSLLLYKCTSDVPFSFTGF